MISGACIAQHDLASLSATVRLIVIETGSRFMLHGPLQFLRRSECDLLASFDLDGSPGAGFRPVRAARFRTRRMPRPVRRILSPRLKWRVASVTKSPSTA